VGTSLGRLATALAAAAWATLGPSPASADEAADALAAKKELEARIAEEDPGWRWEALNLQTSFLYQEGRGLQSQAGPIGGRGREDAWVLQPWAQFRVRQNDQVVHELTVPVDIVSAASTDAVDAVSKASEYNEAVTLDLTSTYSPSEVVDMSFRFGFHYEEPMRSFIGGPSLTFKLFEENTVIGLNMIVMSDGFDPHNWEGKDRGFTARTSFGFNASLVQVLSETTLLDASFGTTQQWGTLETTWNSMVVHREPTEEDPRTVVRDGERFPRSRNRDAFFVRLSQHVPGSGTTGKVGYRFYLDENATFAHTLEAQLFQYIVPWLYVRAHGRLHTQTSPDFWVPFIEEGFVESTKRTSDSDLEAFTSREAGLRVVLLRERAPLAIRGKDSFNLEYLRYQRDNGLHADFGSLGYQKTF
jgi:hypothetical protein